MLSHSRLKWEVTAEQSAQQVGELDPSELQTRPGFPGGPLPARYPPAAPIGKYDIVFGAAAIADMVNFMNYIGFTVD